MSKALWLLPLLFLGACNTTEEIQRSEKASKIDAEYAKKGYATVGTTPDGKPLYFKNVDLGWQNDRVYFTDGAITAVEDCGKNCIKSVTTVVPTLHKKPG